MAVFRVERRLLPSWHYLLIRLCVGDHRHLAGPRYLKERTEPRGRNWLDIRVKDEKPCEQMYRCRHDKQSLLYVIIAAHVDEREAVPGEAGASEQRVPRQSRGNEGAQAELWKRGEERGNEVRAS